ncbi:50S ribosomal protein L1 [Candidatus Profftella armatura]|uniref:Large ribosomal subunit protein uL1 n=1 Tax=Candidatus Profftella armatura TaxID=669502 RepID=S5R0I2_9PROT|nr:50S ribosomal protein L1 [Candidatus Profftella armatura]AGS06717.1 50S ribosomal protein L1 [Candidatus Profftella armatura]ALC95838.1 50S ribosomal protein L1 [Candidatus Profftella armatura]QLK13632.1 50S ribosomal protein L1 [Candidatus Profftella armatura]
MKKLSKCINKHKLKFDKNKIYSFDSAITLIKEAATAKFDESIDISIHLNVNIKRSDQIVRGSIVLPFSTGKKIYIAAFVPKEKYEQAKIAGADIVGMEDLAQKIKSNEVSCDLVIASPESMHIVSSLGKILGPKGLMPNIKDGTLNSDILTAIKNAKSGQIRYRMDKTGIIHASIGRKSFCNENIKSNILALINILNKNKSSTNKNYIRKIYLSSTMGIGLQIDCNIE